MQIKKFVAANIKEATEQMRTELGNNAIILHTRKVPKNSMLKSFGGESVEITERLMISRFKLQRIGFRKHTPKEVFSRTLNRLKMKRRNLRRKIFWKV